MQNDKISFDDFLKSESCLPSEQKRFRPSKPKVNDRKFIPMLIITVISIAAILFYHFNAFVPIDFTHSQQNPSVSNKLLPQYKDGKININTANITMLCNIKYIGKSKALDIVTYRIINGNFKNISEIMNVSGISEATFEKIKDSIYV